MRALNTPEIRADQIELMAKAIHDGYLADLTPAEAAVLPAARPWNELAPHEQAQNRQQAWANIERVVALGYAVVVDVPPDAHPVVQLPSSEIDALAQAEHARWSAQKYAQGYRWGERRCDDCVPRTHPNLVDWSDLDQATKAKDRNSVRRIPSVIAAAGLVLIRQRGN